jgi:hypothetical protein
VADRDARRPAARRLASYGALLPLNEPDPLFALALQQGALLSDDDTPRCVLAAAVPAGARLLRGIFREGLARR